jgi:hypothetical protein
LFLFVLGTANAQCTLRGGPWPTTVRIEPAPALPGVPLMMVLDPPGLVTLLAPNPVREGAIIRVSGVVIDGGEDGIPPPVSQVRVPIGALPEGNYTLVLAPRVNAPCVPMTLAFRVGVAQAPVPVPVQPFALAVMMSLLGLLGIWRLRNERKRLSSER